MRLLLSLILAFSVSTIWAGDKEKETINNAKKPIKVEQPYVKSKGKPGRLLYAALRQLRRRAYQMHSDNPGMELCDADVCPAGGNPVR